MDGQNVTALIDHVTNLFLRAQELSGVFVVFVILV